MSSAPAVTSTTPDVVSVPGRLLGTVPVWASHLVESEAGFYLARKFWDLHQLMFREVDHRTFYLLWVEAVEVFVHRHDPDTDTWDTRNFFECVERFGNQVKRALRSPFAREVRWIERQSRASLGEEGESLGYFLERFERHILEFPEDAEAPEDRPRNSLY